MKSQSEVISGQSLMSNLQNDYQGNVRPFSSILCLCLCPLQMGHGSLNIKGSHFEREQQIALRQQ